MKRATAPGIPSLKVVLTAVMRHLSEYRPGLVA